MPFDNPPDAAIDRLLREARCVAVVGLSEKPERASHAVALALQRYGYRVLPVNPALKEWRGLPAAPDLDHALELLSPKERIDIVDVFRRSEHVRPIIEDCIRLKLPAVWLQRGVIDEAAAQRAQEAGLTVVMDRCIKVERARMEDVSRAR